MDVLAGALPVALNASNWQAQRVGPWAKAWRGPFTLLEAFPLAVNVGDNVIMGLNLYLIQVMSVGHTLTPPSGSEGVVGGLPLRSPGFLGFLPFPKHGAQFWGPVSVHNIPLHSVEHITWKWMAWPLGRLLSSTNIGCHPLPCDVFVRVYFLLGWRPSLSRALHSTAVFRSTRSTGPGYMT